MTPEIYIEPAVVLADGEAIALRPSREEIAARISERMARYREEYPEFAAALDDVMAPFERADPEAAEAFRYSMVARDSSEIATWMGIDDESAAELARRGATAVAGPLGRKLEEQGLVITTVVDEIDPIIAVDPDSGDGEARERGADTEKARAPLSLLESFRAGADSSGWPALIAEVAARGYQKARQTAADVVAKPLDPGALRDAIARLLGGDAKADVGKA